MRTVVQFTLKKDVPAEQPFTLAFDGLQLPFDGVRSDQVFAHTLHPRPYTSHPTPYTLHPAP